MLQSIQNLVQLVALAVLLIPCIVLMLVAWAQWREVSAMHARQRNWCGPSTLRTGALDSTQRNKARTRHHSF